MPQTAFTDGNTLARQTASVSDLVAGLGLELEGERISPSPSLPPVPSKTCPGVVLEIHRELAHLAKFWRAFETSALCTGFQTFDWIEKVQRHVGTKRGDIPVVVIGKDTNGEPAFILPLALTSGGLRRLVWLGSELCDYNGPLLSQNFALRAKETFPVLWREILALLQARPDCRFDIVDLSKNPDLVGNAANPFRSLASQPNPSGAHVATLGTDWESFYASKRSKTTRKREIRQQAKLSEYGDVRFAEATERADLIRTMETLFAQKSRSFARMGIENMFDRPGYRDFYREAAADENTRDFVRVSRLDVGNEVGAANLGLRFRDTYYNVLSSYYDGDFSRFGPGRAHLHMLLERAMKEGCKTFDFTIGDEGYKGVWADIQLTLYDHLEAASLRGWLAVQATVLLRSTKRVIKQTPFLWKAFTALRTLKGSVTAGAQPASDADE